MTAAQEIELLRELAHAYNIDDHTLLSDGRSTLASPETLIAVLRALDAPIESIGDVPDALRARSLAQWQRPMDPVFVAWDGRLDRGISLRMAESVAELHVEAVLTIGAQHLSGRILPAHLTFVQRVELDGVEWVEWRWDPTELFGRVPTGVHELTVTGQTLRGTTTVLSAPQLAGTNRATPTSRDWGVVAPLYSIQSQRSWGIGDLGDLERLGIWASTKGASTLATLPLLAGATNEATGFSPYSPMSRHFWNELYIDIDRIPELLTAPRAAALRSSEATRKEIQRLQSLPRVDYRAVRDLKRRMLEAIVEEFSEMSPGRDSQFRSFVATHPEVIEYARFRAAAERFGSRWSAWPERLRSGHITFSDVDPLAEAMYQYGQWIMHLQVDATRTELERRGVALALDLPLGTRADGYDVWKSPNDYVTGIEAGAPPDAFYPRGQHWGFPPMHPERSRHNGHAALRQPVAFHLAHAPILRIDHVMQFERLWWVPVGAEATEGVYVSGPLEERIAACCVEAALAGGDLVGENLGTVSDELNAALHDHAIAGMHVVQFSASQDQPSGVPAVDAQSYASAGTHDMPTLAGWWEDLDLAEAHGDAQLPAALKERVRSRRQQVRKALWKRIGGTGAPPPQATPELLSGVLTYLAKSQARTVMVPLEDLWLDREPQNRPGTMSPDNWTKIFEHSIADLESGGEWDTALGALAAERPQQNAALAPTPGAVRYEVPGVTAFDIHLFGEGRHFQLGDLLGAHLLTVDGATGVRFAVWAPAADLVSVIGDFNGWTGGAHPLARVDGSDLWQGFIPGIAAGALYKYQIRSAATGQTTDKADPFAFAAEVPPRTASIVCDLQYRWHDAAWMGTRASRQTPKQPIAIYELHLGSWKRTENHESLTYRELAPQLVSYVHEMGFTHVEFMPIMEHPFYGSWGYQISGFFAPTSRYGTPHDFMFLIDALHQAGIGVILDWVPSHFPSDAHALAHFDGTFLFEPADEHRRVQPDWGSLEFDYGRNEVRSFLISNARWWIERYHADGLRADAVASMIYLDYSRARHQWTPNVLGGNEHLEALEFLKQLTAEVSRAIPDALLIAEESTAWPGVTHATGSGGLGFNYKWDLGWMHDTLDFFSRDPVHRRFHQGGLTFRMLYAFTEQFVLPLSHDEVVHGKGALVTRMPGDAWQAHANLRALYGYQYALPGKKLLFMGDEVAAAHEWDHEGCFDLEPPSDSLPAGVRRWVAHLNRMYATLVPLHELDHSSGGFEWISCDDDVNTVIALARRGRHVSDRVVAVFNLTPVPRRGYRVGMPAPGTWRVVANSDEHVFGGSGFAIPAAFRAEPVPLHGQQQSVVLDLPPLSALYLSHDRRNE